MWVLVIMTVGRSTPAQSVCASRRFTDTAVFNTIPPLSSNAAAGICQQLALHYHTKKS
jgi:hypothetical protein